MIGISALWIVLLLGLGGFTLDRVLSAAITRNFDDRLQFELTSMISSSDIGPEGEVLFNRQMADQRFIEPYSGLYFQISGRGFDPICRARCGTGGSRSTSTTSISSPISTRAASFPASG